MRRRRWIRWLLLPSLVLTLLLATFALWAGRPPAPMAEALAALRSDPAVQVETEPWLTFRPADQAPETGLILYPGGRVDPRSYAPLARLIAMQGHLVVILPMPLNLAVLAPERATAVIAAHPEIAGWVIGGHSLGGAMAARYAYRHPDAVDGLLLLAAYPAASDDLSRRSLAVTTVFGSQDGLATPAKVEGSRPLLPPSTRWVRIEGGNHAQFGWYGPQSGDLPAAVSREEQQAAVVEAAAALLEQIRP
ncbi:MAG: alpha/beta fold hydrolase [Bacillota bacterium]